jgi:hypothetical protein
MCKAFLIAGLLFVAKLTFAQVGVGTTQPHSSSILELNSTTKGFLPPRIALTATNAVSPLTTPAAGLLVYNTATSGTSPNNVVPGYYYWSGTAWINLTGNGVPYSGATGAVNLGAYDLAVNDIRVGRGEGTSTWSTAIGTRALNSNTTGIHNTAIGFQALNFNTSGSYNTAIGLDALKEDTSGSYNSAIGFEALKKNTSGSRNSAIGIDALGNNTTGNDNVASGYLTLRSNTTGASNTAYGTEAMYDNLTGIQNTAVGFSALSYGTIGNYNTAIGYRALDRTSGDNNTGVGKEALWTNITGTNLTAIGHTAEVTETNLTNSTVIGAGARVSASNTVSLGSATVTSWVFGIAGTTTSTIAFQVGSTTANGNGAYLTKGGTWTNASSRAFKENFEEIDAETLLEKVRQLPITKWSYKGTTETHIGPMAEDFKESFQLGLQGDNEHISTLDASGVALKAIQALIQKNKELQQQIDELKLLLKSK